MNYNREIKHEHGLIENLKKSKQLLTYLQHIQKGSISDKPWLDIMRQLSQSIPIAFEPTHHFGDGQSFSQYQEDLIVNEIFNFKGTTNKFVVDIGASNGVSLSNSFYFRLYKGWDFCCLDGNPQEMGERLGVKKHWITAENINTILKENGVPFAPDLLSLDLDGNDYHVLKEVLSEFSPRVIIVEINIAYGDRPGFMPYDPNYDYYKNRDAFHGMGYRSCVDLVKEKYVPLSIVCNTNMILIRRDLVEEEA